MRKLRVTEMGRMNAEQYKASAKTPLVLVLDDVRSMYNVGSLFRTADCFRLAGMALCGITACPPHTEIHKTALGAEMTVDWQYFPTALQAVSYLKGRGYHVFSLEQTVGYAAIVGGALLWWFLLTYFVDKVRTRFEVKGVRILNRVIGSIVILASIAGFFFTLTGLHNPALN